MGTPQLWLVGQYRGNALAGPVWDFQGVFETRDLAIAACRDANYFITPCELNAELPHLQETMSLVEYPKCV